MEGKPEWQVTLFLVLFKELAMKNFVFAERADTLQTIAQLGITIALAKECVLALTCQDYFRGPIPDESARGGEYWEFGTTISGQEVFIKLKADATNEVAACFSFHPPDNPIDYPYRQRRRALDETHVLPNLCDVRRHTNRDR